MSQKIQDVLEVLKLIKGRYETYTSKFHVSKIRVDAVQTVANRRGVADRTINDACVRRLQPEINGVERFDDLVWDWLNGRPQQIEQVLRRHLIDQDDEVQISSFFSVSDDQYK